LEALDCLDTATRQHTALQLFQHNVADSCPPAPVRENLTEVPLPPITPPPLACAHVGTTAVLCTAVIPDLTYIAL
jgi:hypothetical protein